jgi:hypothetical protein
MSETPSETVQAAQRLLAERERVGLAKYGTTVDRTDLHAGDWLQHAIEEASDLLLYLIRLRETMQPAPAAAPDDAERAAYLERWRCAPSGATHLVQDANGLCWWADREPYLHESAYWDGAVFSRVGHNLLGSVRCELRPEVQP